MQDFGIFCAGILAGIAIGAAAIGIMLTLKHRKQGFKAYWQHRRHEDGFIGDSPSTVFSSPNTETETGRSPKRLRND